MADLSVPATVAPQSNATFSFGTAGEAITAGQPVYVDSTDSNKIKRADADGTSATAAAKGIAVNSAATGQPVDYQTGGDINLGATLVRGQVYILSPDKGISAAADLANPDYTTILGVAKTYQLLTVKPFASGAIRA